MSPKLNGINFADLADKIRKTIKDPVAKTQISTGDEVTTPTEPDQFVVMPAWWREATQGLLGLPFGYMVMTAGKPDSGKTSSTIEAIREAQKQGVSVIWADTERKTTKDRLVAWGVDPTRLARVQAPYLEAMYKGIERWLNAIKDADPEGKVLIVIDSIGNTASFREAEVEDMEGSQQPGVAAKINKRGLKRLIPRLARDKVALYVINQTYNLMGSPGRKNTGGEGLDYFSALTFQTARIGWLEKTVKGQRMRTGAKVKWDIYKSHLALGNDIMKSTIMEITKEGMKVVATAPVKEVEADSDDDFGLDE